MSTVTTSRRPPAAATGEWPVIPAVRGGGLRPVIARALLTRLAARLPIKIVGPDGRSSGSGGAGAPVLRLHDPGAFFARVGGGAAGFAESYMAGEWDSDDLTGLFTVFAAHAPALVPAPLRASGACTSPRGRPSRTLLPTGPGAISSTITTCRTSSSSYSWIRR